MRAALLLLLLAVPCSGIAQPDERVVKPEIRVGDSWTYRGTGILSPGTDEYVMRVEMSDGQTILVVSTRKGDGKEFDATYTSSWNPTVGVSGLILKPVPEYFSFPLQFGSSRTLSFEAQRPRVTTGSIQYHVTVRIAGWEEITVPAGKFRVVRIVGDGSFLLPEFPRPARVRTTYWYAPEVRRWVKFLLEASNYSSGEELLEFKLNEN